MIFFKFFILGIFTSLLYPPFFMLPLGFIIFPYFIILISRLTHKKSLKSFFISGFFFGLGFLVIFLSWLYNPFLVYKETESYAFLALLLPIFLSIFFGFSFLFFSFFKKKISLIIITPFIFTLTEFLISNFIFGFPWITTSLILSNSTLGFYLIKPFGSLTSGHLILSIFLLSSFFYYKKKNKEKLFFLIYSPFVLIIIFINLYSSNNSSLKKKLNIEVHQLLSPVKDLNKIEVEKNIFGIINNSKADLIIFAENNFPFLLNKDNPFKLIRLFNDQKKVVIGSTTQSKGKYYNSFILIEENHIQFFDKQILVPFGEFLPFRKYLKFMEVIVGSVDFEQGNLQRIITTKDKINILPIICYEIIFDQVFSEVNNNEIDFIINITNDYWFGNKIGPYQHFYITRLKSLIANKPIVRVSNNGISAIIDSNGNIIKHSKLNEVSKINYKINTNNDKSYYHLHKFSTYYLLFIFILLLSLFRKIFDAD